MVEVYCCAGFAGSKDPATTCGRYATSAGLHDQGWQPDPTCGDWEVRFLCPACWRRHVNGRARAAISSGGREALRKLNASERRVAREMLGADLAAAVGATT